MRSIRYCFRCKLVSYAPIARTDNWPRFQFKIQEFYLRDLRISTATVRFACELKISAWGKWDIASAAKCFRFFPLFLSLSLCLTTIILTIFLRGLPHGTNFTDDSVRKVHWRGRISRTERLFSFPDRNSFSSVASSEQSYGLEKIFLDISTRYVRVISSIIFVKRRLARNDLIDTIRVQLIRKRFHFTSVCSLVFISRQIELLCQLTWTIYIQIATVNIPPIRIHANSRAVLWAWLNGIFC